MRLFSRDFVGSARSVSARVVPDGLICNQGVAGSNPATGTIAPQVSEAAFPPPGSMRAAVQRLADDKLGSRHLGPSASINHKRIYTL